MKKIIFTISSLFIKTVLVSQIYALSVKSGNWSDSTVWDIGKVPDGSISAAIMGGHNINVDIPVISALNISQDSNTVLTAYPTGTINVAGYWRNQGQFVYGNSVVRLNGTTDQAIGGVYGAFEFSTIIIDNPTNIWLFGDVKLRNELKFVQGTLKTDGFNFTLVSDSVNTARIDVIPNGSDFDGQITMERYIKSTTAGWKYFGPSATGVCAKDLGDDIPTFGYKGAAVESYSFSSIQCYSEFSGGPLDTGYIPITDGIDGFVAKRGYKVWIDTGVYTIDVKGPPLKFNQAFNITFTDHNLPAEDGWNFITNPYPSAIDWNSNAWTKTNMEDAIYVWNAETQQYAAYVNGISINGGSNIIPTSQAFLVKSNLSNPILACNENVKTDANGTFKRTFTPNTSGIRLTLSNSIYKDETLINFTNNASSKYNGKEDALKLNSLNTNAPNINTVMDAANLSVNSIPLSQNNIDIPVRVKVGVSGNYTIKGLIEMPFFYYTGFILEDLLTKTKIDLKSGVAYNFTISDTTKAPRFVLHLTNRISAPITTNTTNTSVLATEKTTETVSVNGVQSEDESTVKKAANQISNGGTVNKIKFTVFPNPNSGDFTVDISGLENNHNIALYLRDEKGIVVYNSEFFVQDESSVQRKIVPQNKLNNGLYFCTLVIQGIEYTIRVIVS